MTQKIHVKNGDVYGRLTILREAPNSYGRRYVECLCQCGNIKICRLGNLRSGEVTSCGCKRVETGFSTGVKNKTHGKTHHRLYKIYRGIKARCTNKNLREYKHYGGRGIKVCKEWSKFVDFCKWSEENGYSSKLQIDRINNNGNYSPDNCRWTTCKENCSNKSNNVKFNGEMATEACKRLGGQESLIWNRLKLGWSLKKAFTTPVQKHARGIIKVYERQRSTKRDFNVPSS